MEMPDTGTGRRQSRLSINCTLNFGVRKVRRSRANPHGKAAHYCRKADGIRDDNKRASDRLPNSRRIDGIRAQGAIAKRKGNGLQIRHRWFDPIWRLYHQATSASRLTTFAGCSTGATDRCLSPVLSLFEPQI